MFNFLPIICLPTQQRTCCSSLERLTASLGSQFAPSISDVATMYASLYLRRQVLSPVMLLTTVIVRTRLTLFLVILPTPMRSHRCFRKEHFSGGNIKFKVIHRVNFVTPNSPRNSKYLYLIIIVLSQSFKISQSVYTWC